MPLGGLVAAGPEATFSPWVLATQEMPDKHPKSTTTAATMPTDPSRPRTEPQ